jgi:UDP-N-acetylmuramate-alanine ligase
VKMLPDHTISKIKSLDVKSFDFTHLIWWHNHANATLVYQMAVNFWLDAVQVQQSIESFKSLWRRAETIGTNTHWCIIISDYAHHPSELASTYQALTQKFPNQKLHIIFQPHQAQRLLEFRDSAVHTLQQFDTPIVYQIYAAREDVPALLQQYKFDNDTITDWESLGEYFSSVCGAIYMSTESEILDYIDSIDDGIIVLFTAGNLDYVVRSSSSLSR